jgi:hypothetical protein
MSERSRSEQRRLALAEHFASSWGDRSISYAVVHGLERYPVCIGRDLDVAIAPESVARAVETAVARGRDHGFGTALFRWSHWGLYQLALLDAEEWTALALDLLCTTDVWRAKLVRLVDRAQLERITAGDDQLGPFSISEEGRFLKSCVRPLLCGDLSRMGTGREWSLPVTPPHPVDAEQLEELLGEAGASALETASSPDELAALLPAGLQGLQRRWASSHLLPAARSIRDAFTGRVRRRLLNPAACLFVATPEPGVVLEAARELSRAARRMFVDVRPTEPPRSRLRRIAADLGAWRAPPVSEFVVTVVVREPSAGDARLGLLHRVLPTAYLRLTGGLSREQARDVLRTRIVDFLAETYSPSAFVSVPGQAQRMRVPVARRLEETRA